MGGSKTGNFFRQIEFNRRGTGGNVYASQTTLRERPHILIKVTCTCDQTARMAKQRLTRRGRTNAPRVTFQKRAARRLFEERDPLTERRYGKLPAQRRRRDAAACADAHEQVERRHV